MTKKNTAIQGNLSVSMGARIGGEINVKGHSIFNHDIEVKGWIKARNIMGACRGLFRTVEKLKSSYPKPQKGWWALVGDTIPAEIYVTENGEWIDTGKKGGEIGVYPDQILDELSKIENFLNEYYALNSVANTSTLPEEGELEYGKFYYLAGPGTYPNLGNLTVPIGNVGIIKYDGGWLLELIETKNLINSTFLDTKKSTTLDCFLNEINVSLAFPTSGENGDDKYTLQHAINTVFNMTHTTLKILSKQGSRIIFLNGNGNLETWEYYKQGLAISPECWRRINPTSILSKSEYEDLDEIDPDMLYFIYE